MNLLAKTTLIDWKRRYDIDSLDNRDPELIDRLYRRFHQPMMRYFRAEVRGLERIPRGPGLYVGNHSSGLLTPDSFLIGGEAYRVHGIDAAPYGLGHEWAIRLPIAHQLVMPLGAVRACHANADRLFDRGKKVIVYPGGDVDAMRPYRHRYRIVWDGRKGFMRLALRKGVPIIPVVCAGSHATFMILDDMRWLARALRLDRLPIRTHVWPLTLSFPWGLTLFPPPLYVPYPARVLAEVLAPISFERSGPEAAADDDYVASCADHVLQLMQQTLTRLAEERDG